MSNIQLFNFGEAPLRVLGTWENPLFIVKDVCDMLGLSNVTEATRRLEEDELTSVVMNSGVQSREMLAVDESGLFALIFQSRKAEAVAFRRWVTREVLPSIRKTGRYELPGVSNPKPDLRALEEVLLDFLETEGEFKGTAGVLLTQLVRRASDKQFNDPHWPTTAPVFGVALGRLEHSLERHGFEVRRFRSASARTLHLIREEQPPRLR